MKDNKSIYEIMNFYNEQFLNPIVRDLSYSKQDFLFGYLVNKLGYNDLKIALTKIFKGDVYFSNWISVSQLWELKPTDPISKINLNSKQKLIKSILNLTRDEFIEKATHRSILDIEILIDIDEKGEFNTIKEKSIFIYNFLKEFNIPFSCYYSGGKGYHFSILLPHLRYMSEFDRLQYKKNFLWKIGADGLKAGNTMISIENEPHRKTGIMKERVFLDE